MYSIAYLIPRFILIGVIACAMVVGADPLAKRVLTEHIERSTGVIVDIGRVKTKMSQGKVFVNDLAFVDRGNPMANLFQSDMAYLQFDPASIFDRRCVIKNARASQVRLSVPRTVPVREGLVKTSPVVVKPVLHTRFENREEETRMAWMDQFSSNVDWVEPESAEIQIFQVASEANERWSEDFQRQNHKLNSVNVSFAKLANEAITPDEIERNGIAGPPNPLRIAERSAPTDNSQLEAVLRELEMLRVRQQELEAQAALDVKQLESAYQKDSKALKQDDEIEVTEVQPETLSRLLLTKLHEEIAGDAIDWFMSVRGNLPVASDSASAALPPARDGQPRGSVGYRGQFINVGGMENKPAIVIQNLLFDGAGHFQKQHINFSGEAQEISDAPSIHDQPVTFQLRAQGEQHFAVEGSFDRRGENAIDKIAINVPTLPLGPQQLGTESEMLVTLGPKTALHGVIDLRVEGEKISGVLKLEFSNVALLVEKLHEVAGGKEVQVRLNHSLATLQRFESEAHLSGTLTRPQLNFNCSLGQEIADAIAEISVNKTDYDKVAQLDQVDQFYREQVVPLKNNISTELEKIRYAIEGHTDLARKLRASLMTAKSRWPEMR